VPKFFSLEYHWITFTDIELEARKDTTKLLEAKTRSENEAKTRGERDAKTRRKNEKRKTRSEKREAKNEIRLI
jgi:hypothetical protein